jgi:hypothetical protein
MSLESPRFWRVRSQNNHLLVEKIGVPEPEASNCNQEILSN